MKRGLSLVALIACLLFARESRAQTGSWSAWAYGEAAPTGFAAQAGFGYGRKIVFGPAVGVFHSYRLTQLAPEMEAYLGMTAEIGTYVFWAYLGTGFYTDPALTWTGRASFWFIDTRPVGLFTSLYAMWTPTQGGTTEAWLLQPRLGVEVKVGSRLQLVPYLQLTINVPMSRSFQAEDLSLAPGVFALYSW